LKDTWRRGRPIIAASRPDDSDVTIKRRNEKTLLAGTHILLPHLPAHWTTPLTPPHTISPHDTCTHPPIPHPFESHRI